MNPPLVFPHQAHTPHLDDPDDPLPGWKFLRGSGAIALTREYTFATPEVASAFMSFAAGFAALFHHQPALAGEGSAVSVSLTHARRRSVTPRELAFARALVHLEASFHCAAFAGVLEASLASGAPRPPAKEPA